MILKFCKEIPKDYFQVLATVIQGTLMPLKETARLLISTAVRKNLSIFLHVLKVAFFFPFLTHCCYYNCLDYLKICLFCIITITNHSKIIYLQLSEAYIFTVQLYFAMHYFICVFSNNGALKKCIVPKIK